MKSITFGIVGQEVDLMSKRLLERSHDPRETLEVSVVLERLWGEMYRAKTDLQALLKKILK